MIRTVGSRENAPEEIRTPNLLIRSQMLYPVELRAQNQRLTRFYLAKSGYHVKELYISVSLKRHAIISGNFRDIVIRCCGTLW